MRDRRRLERELRGVPNGPGAREQVGARRSFASGVGRAPDVGRRPIESQSTPTIVPTTARTGSRFSTTAGAVTPTIVPTTARVRTGVPCESLFCESVSCTHIHESFSRAFYFETVAFRVSTPDRFPSFIAAIYRCFFCFTICPSIRSKLNLCTGIDCEIFPSFRTSIPRAFFAKTFPSCTVSRASTRASTRTCAHTTTGACVSQALPTGL